MFSDLPYELQIRLLESEPGKIPLLSKTFNSDEYAKRLICGLYPKRTEFRNFLLEAQPLKFGVYKIDPDTQDVDTFLFNRVLNDDQGEIYWEVIWYYSYLDDDGYEFGWVYLDKTFESIIDYLSSPRQETTFNVNDVINLIYEDQPGSYRFLDPLTHYRIISRRSVCYHNRQRIMKIQMDDFMDNVSKLMHRAKTKPLLYFRLYSILVPVAWSFNFGNLVIQKDIQISVDGDGILVQEDYLKPDFKKLVTCVNEIYSRLFQLKENLELFI